MALSADEQTAIVKAVEDGVIRKLTESSAPLVVAVKLAAADQADDKAKRDPYRPLLHFVTGLLAFCLALLVALFAALGADKGPLINSLVSWVLMGMAATAAIGTVAIGVLQLAKTLSPDTFSGLGIFGALVAGLAVLCGGYTVWLCIDEAKIVAGRYCIAKPAEGMSDPVLTQFLKAQKEPWQTFVPAFAQARAHDCLILGDLAASAAWAKIATTIPAPPQQQPSPSSSPPPSP